MDIFAIIGVAVITAVAATVMKQLKEEYAVFVSLCGGLIILTMVFAPISEITAYMKNLMQTGSMDMYFSIILKSLAIAFAVQICADICRDMGESSVASKVEFAGKIAIVAVCLPAVKSIVGLGVELLT